MSIHRNAMLAAALLIGLAFTACGGPGGGPTPTPTDTQTPIATATTEAAPTPSPTEPVSPTVTPTVEATPMAEAMPGDLTISDELMAKFAGGALVRSRSCGLYAQYGLEDLVEADRIVIALPTRRYLLERQVEPRGGREVDGNDVFEIEAVYEFSVERDLKGDGLDVISVVSPTSLDMEGRKAEPGCYRLKGLLPGESQTLLFLTEDPNLSERYPEVKNAYWPSGGGQGVWVVDGQSAIPTTAHLESLVLADIEELIAADEP